MSDQSYNKSIQTGMSIKSIIELLLHVEHYQIVEYPKQGLFSFKISLYQLSQKQKIYGIPYQQLPSTLKEEERSTRLLVSPKIEDQMFITTVGLAKYSDQILTLDDWVQFRIETEAYPTLNCDNIFLEIELRFNSTKLHEPQTEGELLQTVTLKLNDIENGLFASSEAEFDSPYLSKLMLSGLAYLTTFKFSKFESQNQEMSSLQKKRLKINSIEQLVQFTQKQMPSVDILELFYTNYIKKLRIVQYLLNQKLQNYLTIKQPITQIKVSKQFMIQRQITHLSQKDFKFYLDTFLPSKMDIVSIMQELNQIREENFIILCEITRQWRSDRFDIEKCHEQYSLYEREKYGQRVFKSVIAGRKEIMQKKQLSSKQNKKIAKQIRGKNITLNSHPIEDIRAEGDKEDRQIIFYQVSFPFKDNLQKKQMLHLKQGEVVLVKQGCNIQYCQKNMVIVLCHGFQGTSYDMHLLKRWIQKQLPDANFLISRINQDQTEGNLREMGKRLAQEIKNYIQNYLDQYQQENVILNLVGHSMGGVIARAALPHLQQYKQNLGFFCSLSSPHLGYLNGVSGLVKVGLWAIRKWKSIQSLQQLSMEQKGNPRKTFLYQLSQTGHLRYFRKIILLSSFEDSYVSWHSARISSHRSKNSQSVVEGEMEENIMGNNIYGASVHRIDINFNVKTKDLDSFIGRKAHIELIIREKLFKNLGMTIPELFQLTEYGREGLFL